MNLKETEKRGHSLLHKEERKPSIENIDKKFIHIEPCMNNYLKTRSIGTMQKNGSIIYNILKASVFAALQESGGRMMWIDFI